MKQVLGNKNDSPSKLAEHRADVYHQAFEIILEDLKLSASYGVVVKVQNDLKKGTTVLATASADYEEMCATYICYFLQC